jgi:MoaA/NifB/PqqE/SkfB family radical SAM enzyme
MDALAMQEDTKFSRILRWRNGETPGPWEMQVHPTNRCNLKCKICWERRAEVEIGPQIYDKAQEVSDERLLHLVDESAEMGVREWTIVGGGEPMIRDELVIAMCERIRGHGMTVALHTNATRFTREHFERLMAAGLDFIRISLDGPTQALNDAIRGKGFDKAVQNIRLLNEMKRAAGTQLPRLSMHPVITNITHEHLKELVELAADLECELICFAQLIFERDDELGTVFLLDPAQRESLDRELARAAERAKELGVVAKIEGAMEHGSSELGLDHLGRTRFGDGRMSDANCFEVWLSAVVHVNGNVGPCCVSYEDRANNIKESSLRDVWLGPYLQEVRRRIFTDGAMPYCVGCPSYITPRSESIRHDLSKMRWKEWAGMSTPQQLRTVSGQFLGNLRQRGLTQTLRRAWRRLQASRG